MGIGLSLSIMGLEDMIPFRFFKFRGDLRDLRLFSLSFDDDCSELKVYIFFLYTRLYMLVLINIVWNDKMLI